jgi:crotonobetainyl-CoA:carnitine CoA-transferase CaiB-like acyl-CoA transferase
VSGQSALSGITVIEASQGKSAAFCAKILADLGAYVLKLEPPGGDPGRRDGPRPSGPSGQDLGGDGGMFTYLNTSKNSRILDTADPAQLDELRSLMAVADVFIEDEYSGTIGDVDFDSPSLVRCAVTPFGLTGPYGGYKATHLNLFHAGGESPVIPIPADGWPPLQVGSEMSHYDVGCHAAIAIVGALCGRERNGKGSSIDVSAQETLVSVNRTMMVQLIYDAMHYTYNTPESENCIFATKTGYVVVVPRGGTDELFRTLVNTPGGELFDDERLLTLQRRQEEREALTDALKEWCAQQTQADAVRFLLSAGLGAGAVMDEEDLLNSEQLKLREYFQSVAHPTLGPVLLPGLPFKLSETPAVQAQCPGLGQEATHDWTPASPVSAETGEVRSSALPLEGIRVIDFTWQAAGPYGTLMLSLMGAEVIRVEHPSRPDTLRRGFQGSKNPARRAGTWPYGSPNRSPNFLDICANKRSLQLNLKHECGPEIIEALLPKSDIVVSNFRPGIMERYGWDGPSLVQRLPHLVVAESSAYGAFGPEALAAGFAMTFAATGGIDDQTGYPDGPPTQLGFSPDFRSGAAFALGILVALLYRERTGHGQVVDFSSRESVVSFSPDALIRRAFGLPKVDRLGNRHPRMAPHNVYPALGQGRWISIAVTNDTEWAALCEVLGHAQWLSRFPTEELRKANEVEIDKGISAWTAELDAFEAFDLLQSRGIPAAPSFWNDDIVDSPHLRERRMFVTLEHAELGEVQILRAPWIFDGQPAREMRTAGPLLGEAGGYVLEEVLQVTPEERSRLGEALR